MGEVDWVIVVARLPTEPSRHRVAVWRELRRAGALPLGGGAWTAPAGSLTEEVLAQVHELVERADGGLLVLDATARNDATAKLLRDQYTAGREAEWSEFLNDCDRYTAELAHEVAIEKFTLAELEEEEQSLDRLRRWHRSLSLRDRFGASSAPEAERRLDTCAARLHDYSELVYRALHQT